MSHILEILLQNTPGFPNTSQTHINTTDMHSLESGLYRLPGMVGLAFFVTGLGWSGLASFLSNRAGLERAGLGWQVLTKTGLQGFSLA